MPELTRDDLSLTDLDAQILARLADRMARVRPAWLADDYQNAGAAFYARTHLSLDLLSRYFSEYDARRALHHADVQRMRDMDRQSRADWLPAASIEYLEG
jgi:hypothetical protein